MKQIELIDISSGKSKRIDFPESLSEVKLANKIAFDVCNDQILKWIEDEKSDPLQYLYLISLAISQFLDIDLNLMLNLDVSSFIDIDGNISNDNNDIKTDLRTSESILFRLYSDIQNLINSYEYAFKTSSNYTFSYNNINYKIPYIIKTLFSGKKVFSSFSTAQAVEILQVKKLLFENFENKEYDFADISLKNARFTAYLQIISIVVLEKDEKFPVNDIEITENIEEKMLMFKDIDLKLANDILFFLIHIITH